MSKKQKTVFTLAEATAAAFKAYLVKLSSYDMHDFARGNAELADLLLALVTGGEAWVQETEGGGYHVRKPSRAYVESRFQAVLEARQTENVLKCWANANCMQRLQVGDEVRYECYNRDALKRAA